MVGVLGTKNWGQSSYWPILSISASSGKGPLDLNVLPPHLRLGVLSCSGIGSVFVFMYALVGDFMLTFLLVFSVLRKAVGMLRTLV